MRRLGWQSRTQGGTRRHPPLRAFHGWRITFSGPFSRLFLVAATLFGLLIPAGMAPGSPRSAEASTNSSPLLTGVTGHRVEMVRINTQDPDLASGENPLPARPSLGGREGCLRIEAGRIIEDADHELYNESLLRLREHALASGYGGCRRDQDFESDMMAVFYFPSSTPVQQKGVLVLHDFGGNALSAPVRRLAEGLAASGLFVLAPNLSHHDGEYLGDEARFAHNLWQISGAIRHMERQGLTEIFLLGIGFGTLDAVFYCAKTTDCSPSAGARVRAAGHYGTSPAGRADLRRSVGIPPEERSNAMAAARALVNANLTHEYLIGIGVEWSIQAVRLIDYFDDEGPAAEAALVASQPGRIAWQIRDDEDWVARTLTEITSVSGALVRAGLSPAEVSYPRLTPCRALEEASRETLIENHVVLRTDDFLGLLYQPIDRGLRGSRAIVVSHGGDGGTVFDYTSYSLSRCLAIRGYTVLALQRIDAGPRFSDVLFDAVVQDVGEAVRYLSEGLAFSEIYLHAHSETTLPVLHFQAQHGPGAVRGVIVSGGVDEARDFYAAHIRQESRERALRIARDSSSRGLSDRWLSMPWCGWDDPTEEWCLNGQAYIVMRTAAHVLSYLGERTKADGVTDIRDVQVPVLILRSEADMVTTCDRSLRLFGAATSAPNVTLVDMRGNPNNTWQSSRRAHGLIALGAIARTAIDTWIESGGATALEPTDNRKRVLWRAATQPTNQEWEAGRCLYPEEFFAVRDGS
jgi:hypothetical protein